MIFSSIRYFFYVALVAFLLTGCNDDPSLVGEGILPDKDVIQGSTILIDGLIAENVSKDAILSDKVDYAILGELNDPMFGYSKGEFVTQINSGAALDSARFNLPDYYVDSLMLNLALTYKSGWYGDTLAKHKISVYELTDALSNDLTSYYSNTSMAGRYSSTPIGELDFVTDRNSDSAWYVKDYVDTLRIKLSEELKNRFFSEVDKNLVANNKAFRDWFKGVYISTTLSESTVGSLLRIKAWDSGLGIKIYYHHMEDTTKYPHENLFPITLEGTDFNIFNHTPSANISFNNPQTDYLYCQGMAGSYVHIKLPDDIYNFKDSLATNEEGYSQDFSSVTLEFFVDTTKSEISKFPPPSTLQLYRYNEKTNKLEVPFMHYRTVADTSKYEKNSMPVGYATYNTTSMSYKFIISNDFFKRVVTKDDDILPQSARAGKGEEDDFQDIYIGPYNPSQNMNRVVFYGKENSTKRGVEFKVRMIKYLSKI